jgi:hypothetical protein
VTASEFSHLFGPDEMRRLLFTRRPSDLPWRSRKGAKPTLGRPVGVSDEFLLLSPKRGGNTSSPCNFRTWMPPSSPLTREAQHDVDQLAVCGAGQIAQFGSRVLVCEPAQAQQLAQALSPIELWGPVRW